MRSTVGMQKSKCVKATPAWQSEARVHSRRLRDATGCGRYTLKGFRMRLRHSLCWVLAAASVVTVSAVQRPPAQSDQQILMALERRWNEAFYRKDVAFIETVLADEFMATYDDGSRGDKAKELALVAEFNQQVESAIQDEFTVKVYRDTAVVWFTLKLVGIKQGQKSELTLRYTDVWVMRDGRWQCVSTQSTRVTAR